MIKLRWDDKTGLTTIPLPTPDEIRSDPAYAAGNAALAAAVLKSALEDLSDQRTSAEERQAAKTFLLANPMGDSDLDRVFAHWWAYFSPYCSLHRLRALVAWAERHPRPMTGIGMTSWTQHAERHGGAWRRYLTQGGQS